MVDKVSIAFASSLGYLVAFDDYVNAIYQRQNFTEEVDFESIKERLQEAYAAPLDLNKATEASLDALGILSKNQIKNYFTHLATTGPLYSRYELQAIPDFDLVTIALLLPFVYVAETYYLPYHCLKSSISKSNYFLFRYMPPLRSTDFKSTLGNLDGYTVQFLFDHKNDITWGITARKQAGESFCWDHATYRYGFNLWSIFVMVNHKKYIKRMVVGDYQIGHGQGLLLSAGYTHQGDAISSVIRYNHIGIRPYKAIRRVGLRGLAITSDVGVMELTGFYSNHNLDAALQLNEKCYIHRIDSIGKYDTTYNLAKKGVVNEQVLGCTIRKQCHRNQTEVGMNLLYNHYDIPVMLKDEAAVSYVLQNQLGLSLFYRLLWKNWIGFGELGFTFPNSIWSKKSKALITGYIISFSRYIDLSGIVYYYGKGWYTPYGNGFKHYSTDHGNEKGGYVCLQFTPLSSWKLTTSSHFFTILCRKPHLKMATIGHCFITRSNYILHRSTILLVQYKLYHHPRNTSKAVDHSDGIQVQRAIQNSFKCRIDHKLTHYWWSNLEVQYTHYTFLGELHHGYALSSRQKWKIDKWQFTCKSILFKAQNYSTRLYFYLPNPLYSGTQFRGYSGNGMATTWLVCWRPVEVVRLEIQYTFIYLFDNINKTESVYNCLPTRSKHNGTIQILINF